jgi:hypothetical protein
LRREKELGELLLDSVDYGISAKKHLNPHPFRQPLGSKHQGTKELPPQLQQNIHVVAFHPELDLLARKFQKLAFETNAAFESQSNLANRNFDSFSCCLTSKLLLLVGIDLVIEGVAQRAGRASIQALGQICLRAAGINSRCLKPLRWRKNRSMSQS